MKQENEVSKFIKKLGIETDPLGRVKIDVGVLEKIKPMPSGNYYKEVILSNPCRLAIIIKKLF